MSKPEFVELRTKDGLTLPGLFYQTGRSRTVAIYLHGNGSSSIFYNTKKNEILAGALSKENISTLFFNNRGAHIIKKLYVGSGERQKRRSFGMAYEKIRDCVQDIDGAIAFLKKRGNRRFYLIGASTGANKICVYNYYRPKNPVAKYVLLCGGDDTGIYYQQLGRGKFCRLLNEAKRKNKTGHGQEIVKELLPDNVFSYVGFFDIANPDGDYNIFPFREVIRQERISRRPLFRHFKRITKPTLVVYGDKDEWSWGDVPRLIRLLKHYQPRQTYRIIKGADHGFKGREKQLAGTIAKWL